MDLQNIPEILIFYIGFEIFTDIYTFYLMGGCRDYPEFIKMSLRLPSWYSVSSLVLRISFLVYILSIPGFIGYVLGAGLFFKIVFLLFWIVNILAVVRLPSFLRDKKGKVDFYREVLKDSVNYPKTYLKAATDAQILILATIKYLVVMEIYQFLK